MSQTSFERVAISAAERQDALYSHIVVRTDLPLAAQMAQCAHAAQEAMRLSPGAERPIHIVILAAAGERDLIEGARALEREGLAFHLFHEAHWPRGHTALGCAPQPKTAALKRALSRFELWRAPEPAPAPPMEESVRVEAGEDPLNPRLDIPPAKEREARLLFALNRLSEQLSEAEFDLREGPSQERGAELAAERLRRLCDDVELMEQESGLGDDQSFEYWSAFAERRRFASFWAELSRPHCGDCTAVACSCARCHMEGFLGVDTSPPSKHQGHHWLRQSMAAAASPPSPAPCAAPAPPSKARAG